MKNYNIFNVIYLTFRLGPLIVICYFLLQSLFNYDLRGLVYLCGLIIASVISSVLGDVLDVGSGSSEGRSYRCNTLFLGSIPITSGSIEPLSKLPLNIVVYSYTLAYLVTAFTAPPISYVNALASLQQNMPVLILFPLLLIFEAVWLSAHSCNNPMTLFVALIIGIAVGIFWAFMMRLTKNANIQYMSMGNIQVCSRPSKTVYRCRNIGT
jgi:hypothetical protein